MIAIFSALFPVFLMIALGYIIKNRALISDSFWVSAEKMTFYIFFPALLLINTAQANFDDTPVTPVILASASGVLIISGLVFWMRPRLGVDGPAFTSVFQGTIRPNVYLGVAAAVALYDSAGLTLISVCVAVMVPLVNILSIIVLVRYASISAQIPGWSQTMRLFASNPLILACGAGIILNVTGIGRPPLISPFLEILGYGALPIGLLAVGSGLDFTAMAQAGKTVALTTAIKIIALPVVTFVTCHLFGVSGLSLTIAVLYAALPISATSYVLARQMGGDTALLAGTITATTVAAMFTMPLTVLLLS
jgi:predicted permease